MRFLVIAVVCCAWLSGTSSAAGGETKTASPASQLADLATAASLVAERFAHDAVLRPVTRQLQSDATFLNTSWLQSGAADVSVDYVNVLGFEAQGLHRAATGDLPDVRAFVSDVARDVNVKARYCKARLALGEGLGKPITVKVHTLKSGQEVSYFLVRGTPIRFASAQPMVVFTKPSSPTESEPVSAGYYLVWAVDPKRPHWKSAPQPEPIGMNGSDKVDIPLPVDH